MIKNGYRYSKKVLFYYLFFNIKRSIMNDVSDISKEEPNFISRAGKTLNKYRNQMAWRRNKVREMLTRGYSQYEIANTLRISQPTISRDIHYLQKEIHKIKDNYGERLFEVYQNSLLGTDELIKKLWTIIDSSKTDEKEKMKAINLIMQCYKMRFEMIKSEPELINQKRYMKDLSIMDV
jgi:predicted transcriptional regulator